MSTLLSSTVTEDELRLRMDRRTVAQQEHEIRHLRVRLEKLAARQALLESVDKVPSDKTLKTLAA
jgi:hypothetical protein